MHVETSTILKARREAIFNLIADFSESRVKIFPWLKSQRVVGRDGDSLILEFEEEVLGRVWRTKGRFYLYPPERMVEEVESGLITGTVTWLLTEIQDGTKFTLTLEAQFKNPLLRLLTHIVKGRVRRRLERMILQPVASALEVDNQYSEVEG